MFIGFVIFCIFQIPVAVAQNLETVMLCRFFSGFFGSSPLAVVGGTLTDFWGPVDRGVAMAVFAGATFLGPVMGPVIGGFITESHLGWRWTAWVTLILGGAFGIIGFIAIPETYHPKLLQTRAAKLRHRTRNWAYHSKADEEIKDAKTMINTYLFRPIHMLIREPILLLITLYLTLVYGLLYLFFEAYPISFQQERHWAPGIGSLPFLALLVGILIGCLIVIILTKTRFVREFEKHNGRVPPEERLPPMIIGAFILPIGLFWFGWTSSPHISWVPQVLAGVPIGTGILLIFLQGLNYIIDVYKWHANSAIAASTFVRALAAAGFPMFASAMFKKLGVDWAISLLGFLAVILIPVPIAFFRYGERVRGLSRFSPK
jgi:DHA1 family multidrug resistance protein-like MFS transporter